MRLNWILWLIVLIILAGLGEGMGYVLAQQGAQTPSLILRITMNLIANAWFIYGLYRWRNIPWVAKFTRFGVLSIATFALIVLLNSLGFNRGAIWAGSIWIMGALFAVTMTVLKMALGINWPICGVARTVLSEALSSKMAIAFICALFVLLPSIQLFLLVTETRVEYQIKSFLTFSLLITGGLLGFLTILQGAWSISQERERKQIFLTMTKPISRLHYLAGKWLGLTVLNLGLIFVAGVGIYLFTMQLKNTDQYFDAKDRAAVDQRVLTARQQVMPKPSLTGDGFNDMVRQAILDRVRTDPTIEKPSDIGKREIEKLQKTVLGEWLQVGGLGAPGAESEKTYYFDQIPSLWNPLPIRGALGAHQRATEEAEKQAALETVREGLSTRPNSQHKRKALSLLADIEAGQPKHLALDDLIKTQFPEESIQLQIKPRAVGEAEENRVRLMFVANGTLLTPPQYDPTLFNSANFEAMRRNNSWALSENVFSVVDIPASYINEDGTLELTVQNMTATGSSVSFRKDNGLQLLYRTGAFAPNYIKTLGLLWIRLMFIGMVTIAVGSFLSFPVASLFAFVVFFAAIGAKYLTDSLEYYAAIDTGHTSPLAFLADFFSSLWQKISQREIYEAIKVLISAIAQLVVLVVPDLSKASGTINLRDGIELTTWSVVMSFVRVVLASTVVAWLFGWLVFRKRELARVIV